MEVRQNWFSDCGCGDAGNERNGVHAQQVQNDNSMLFLKGLVFGLETGRAVFREQADRLLTNAELRRLAVVRG